MKTILEVIRLEKNDCICTSSPCTGNTDFDPCGAANEGD